LPVSDQPTQCRLLAFEQLLDCGQLLDSNQLLASEQLLTFKRAAAACGSQTRPALQRALEAIDPHQTDGARASKITVQRQVPGLFARKLFRCSVLYVAVPCCTLLHVAVPCCLAVPCCALLCRAVPCCAVLCRAVRCCTLLYLAASPKSVLRLSRSESRNDSTLTPAPAHTHTHTTALGSTQLISAHTAAHIIARQHRTAAHSAHHRTSAHSTAQQRDTQQRTAAHTHSRTPKHTAPGRSHTLGPMTRSHGTRWKISARVCAAHAHTAAAATAVLVCV